MKPEVEHLVREAFNTLTGNELMELLRMAAIIHKEKDSNDELEDIEKAAIHVLQAVLNYLTHLGVIEDVPVLH